MIILCGATKVELSLERERYHPVFPVTPPTPVHTEDEIDWIENRTIGLL